tara:strand:- start:22 stop:240 length:219 start_codon:yes stop_codon:yes gene_type:complete
MPRIGIPKALQYGQLVESVNNRVENLCVGMNQEVDPITFKMNLRLFLEELEDEVLEHHRMLWEDASGLGPGE